MKYSGKETPEGKRSLHETEPCAIRDDIGVRGEGRRAQQREGVDLKPASYILRVFGDAVFPHKCRSCGMFFHSDSRGHFFACAPDVKKNLLASGAGNRLFETVMSRYLCGACAPEYSAVESPFCAICGKLFKSREGENHVCGDCLTAPKHFSAARAAGIYDASLMTLIHRLKYNGRTELAKPLGALLFSAFITHYGNTAVDLVMPVPLHTKRFRKRGFNQAYLLVKNWMGISRELQDDKQPVPVDIKTLVRTRRTLPQTGLGRDKRLANIKNAFAVKNAGAVQGKRILLVDDVYTTGATADECAKVLLKNGAERVDVMTLARGVQV